MDRMSGYATTYACDDEVEFWVLGGKLREALYGGLQALKTFHRRNGITLPLKAFALNKNVYVSSVKKFKP